VRDEPLGPDSPAAVAGPAAEAETMLLVPLGAARYVLPLRMASEVTEIAALRPVPLAPEWILGLVGRRGRIVIVLDLARILHEAEAPEPRSLVRLEAPFDHLALAVPSAPRLVSVARTPSGVFLPHAADEREGAAVLLDPAGLIGAPRTAAPAVPSPR
jgi:hypothetical protein